MNSFALVAVPLLYKRVMTALMGTCTVRTVGAEPLEELSIQGRPWVICAWHENISMGVYRLRKQKIAMMASASRDGELIARAIERFGNVAIRGSSSSLGGQAARDMARAIRAGGNGAITPDGPRGPAYRCQSGVLWIAAICGCPLVPYALEAERQWRIRSWDRHKIPKPFTTVHEHFGEPFYVPRDALAESGTLPLAALQHRMMENTRACQRAAGHNDKQSL